MVSGAGSWGGSGARRHPGARDRRSIASHFWQDPHHHGVGSAREARGRRSAVDRERTIPNTIRHARADGSEWALPRWSASGYVLSVGADRFLPANTDPDPVKWEGGTYRTHATGRDHRDVFHLH